MLKQLFKLFKPCCLKKLTQFSAVLLPESVLRYDKDPKTYSKANGFNPSLFLQDPSKLYPKAILVSIPIYSDRFSDIFRYIPIDFQRLMLMAVNLLFLTVSFTFWSYVFELICRFFVHDIPICLNLTILRKVKSLQLFLSKENEYK